MTIDLWAEGIPEEGIPSFEVCTIPELPNVANRIIEYAIRQAREKGVNLNQPHERSSFGYELQYMLDSTAQQLHLGFSELRDIDIERDQAFARCMGMIAGALENSSFANNARRRQKLIGRIYEERVGWKKV